MCYFGTINSDLILINFDVPSESTSLRLIATFMIGSTFLEGTILCPTKKVKNVRYQEISQ